ncbi:hypothetical protein TA3x_002579 [Tundrisphaera sp. TA3]|uniref:hypothetical protein n=1 Tax=Tundrisphaera sp. TA3 TaxID=3435775 RepID=UPI003EB94FC4
MGRRMADEGDWAEADAQGWPVWAKRLTTLAVLFHAAAIWAGAWAAAPASGLERALADRFSAYNQFIDQGYSYRYYSPEPPPTPVVTAELSYADGRPSRTVRLPERGTWPRLRYQRQLALANALAADFEDARTHAGDGSRSRWAHAYATHLGKENPGCSEVTLRLQMHLIPPLERVRDQVRQRGFAPVDLDAEEFYSTPERIGVYPCNAS